MPKIKMINGQWSMSSKEIPEVLELGRLLYKTCLEFAQARNGGKLHLRIVVAALQYVLDMQNEKTHVLTDDFAETHRLVNEHSLVDQIEEPLLDLVQQEEPKQEEVVNVTPIEDVKEEAAA